MTFACPICGHALTKKGSWFKSASHFKCAGCQTRSRISYEDKLRLFAAHDRKINQISDTTPNNGVANNKPLTAPRPVWSLSRGYLRGRALQD
jgi:hypothetical protein